MITSPSSRNAAGDFDDRYVEQIRPTPCKRTVVQVVFTHLGSLPPPSLSLSPEGERRERDHRNLWHRPGPRILLTVLEPVFSDSRLAIGNEQLI